MPRRSETKIINERRKPMRKYYYFTAFGIVLLAIVLAPIRIQSQEIIEGHCKALKVIATYQSPWQQASTEWDELTVMGLTFDGEHLWAVGRSHPESEDQDTIFKLAETDTGLEIVEYYEAPDPPDPAPPNPECNLPGSGSGIAFDLSKKSEPQLWLTDDCSKLIYRVEIFGTELVIQESFDPGVLDSSGIEKYGKYFWISACSGDSISGYPAYLYKIRTKKDVMDTTIIDAPGYCPIGTAYDGSFIWSVDHMWEENPDGDMVYKLSTSGKILCSYDFSMILNNATGITFDGDTYMWVADRGNIYKLEFDE
jgi:hypothetical protein